MYNEANALWSRCWYVVCMKHSLFRRERSLMSLPGNTHRNACLTTLDDFTQEAQRLLPHSPPELL